jgi:dipeptidyl aminopeptidase/acylaminoacyl peptidase
MISGTVRMPYAPSAWVAIGAATSPALSKDGRTIFHLRGAGLPQVWAMDRNGGNARALSQHNEKVAFLRRSPADDRLVWGIDAGGDERQQFWTLPPGDVPIALTEAPVVIYDFGAFSPDGSRIAYAANDRDERCFDVCCWDFATGAVTRLYETDGAIAVSGWSSTGDRLVATVERSSSDQTLWIIDAADGAARALAHPGLARFAAIRWTADGTGLMGLTDQGGADFMRLCRIDPETGAADPVFAPAGRDMEAWSLSPDGALLATVENDRGWAVLRIGPPEGERPAVAGLPALVSDLAWAPDSQALAFTAQGPAEPPGIWLWDAAAARAATIWRPDTQAEAGVARDSLATPDLVSWPSFDGTPIAGWFARPRSPAPATGYPAVVWVHGGPAAQTRPNWRPDIQMLLDHGYAVLMPNVRGSTGYGRAFMESDDFDKRPAALADLVAGHAWLTTQHDIDVTRIGIMGQSYGGWMVLAAITQHPDLWRAAVDYYGIADFVTLLRNTGPWRRDHRAREYGFPDSHAELFARISPIHHVGRVTAPLLVCHGNRDPRVPMTESDQFVAAMERHQKQVRYERFDYAGHGFIRPDHRHRVWTAVAEHFATHLLSTAP